MDKLLNGGDVVIDVGANIGLMSIHASLNVGKSGKIYSFEANPETAKLLLKNLALNNIKNVSVIQKALGSDKSTGKIYSNWHINRGGASLIKPAIESEFFDVKIIPFKDFHKSESIKKNKTGKGRCRRI